MEQEQFLDTPVLIDGSSLQFQSSSVGQRAIEMMQVFGEPIISPDGRLDPKDVGLWHVSAFALGRSLEAAGIPVDDLQDPYACRYETYLSFKASSENDGY